MTEPPDDPFEHVSDETIEIAARAVHARYLSAQAHPTRPGVDRTGRPHPAMRAWDDALFSPELRRQNYDQVRNNVLRLDALGYRLTPLAGTDGRLLAQEAIDALVEALARSEHDRWCRLKRRQGYVHGLVRQDDPAVGPRTHPDLVGWDDLDDASKDKDREPVRTMLTVFAEAGLGAVEV